MSKEIGAFENTTRHVKRSSIQPVSRVMFRMSDTDAFEKCIKLCVGWMSNETKGVGRRSGVALPLEAWEGQDFDITDIMGANPTKAVRINAIDAKLWSARLDWPDPKSPRTWVSEFFVEKKAGELARFGAQVTCVLRGDCPPFEATRPNVISSIIKSLSVEEDGSPLSNDVTQVDIGDLYDLQHLMFDSNRRLPILLMSQTKSGCVSLDTRMLASRVGGAAHLISITEAASWELTKNIGKKLSTYNGAVRLYKPGLTEENDDPFDHPLWMEGKFNARVLIRTLAGRVLKFSFLSELSDRQFYRYSSVRDASYRARISLLQGESYAAEERQLTLLELDEAREERDTWQSLAADEQQKRVAAERDVERLKSELVIKESKIAALSFSLRQVDSGTQISVTERMDRALVDYEDMETWSIEVLGEHVELHQHALRDCRKNGSMNMLDRIEKTLLIMRDHVVPARRDNNRAERETAREKLAALGVEDSPCFVDRNEAKRTPGYSVKYRDEDRVLYDHLKYGNGYDNNNQFRIYYFWDELEGKIVIGKMPSHLRNNMTN